MPDNFASTDNGLIVICNGIDKASIWRGTESTVEDAGLVAPDSPVTGTGDGAGSMTGSYFAYVTYVRSDGFESSLSPVSASIVLNNHQEIDYTNVPVSPDSRVVARRIYRNTNGQARTVYLDVTIEDNVTTTASSSLIDTLLQVQTSFALFELGPGGIYLPRAANNNPPPDTKPFVVEHLGVTYYAGYEDYAEGSCEVTLNSNVVQGRGTRWRSNWAARLLYVDGADQGYEIASVDEDLQQITLVDPYPGATNLFAAYTVRPTEGECWTLYYSGVNQPEAVNPLHAITIPQEGGPVTGLMSMYGFLYILKRKSIFRFTVGRNPLLDGALYPANNRGCINQRCAVVVSDTAFILDERGAYIFSGGQDVKDLTGPIQDIFRDGTESPINWQASRYFHGAHSPGESAIRWFVNFRGDYQPRHCLSFCYSLQRWWVEYYDRPVGASCLGLSGRTSTGWGKSVEQVYYGLDASQIVAPRQAVPELVQQPKAQITTVLESTFTTVTCNATFGNDCIGAPLVLRSQEAGLQSRRIIAVDGNTVTVHPPWSRMPEADDEVIFGGFIWQMQTHDVRYSNTEVYGERSVEVFYEPNPKSKMDVEILHDDDAQVAACNLSYAENEGVETQKNREAIRLDMSLKTGFAILKADGLREGMTQGRRRMGLRFTGVGGNGQDALCQIVQKGVTA